MRINGILENLNLEPIEVDQVEVDSFLILADYLGKSYDEKYSGLMKKFAQEGKEQGSVNVSVEDVDTLTHIVEVVDDDIIDGAIASEDVRKALLILDNFISDIDVTMISESSTEALEKPPLLNKEEMETLYYWINNEGPFRMGSEFREFLSSYSDKWDRGRHSLKNAAVRMHGIIFARLPGAMVRAGKWFARNQFGSIYHFLNNKGYDVEHQLTELEKSLEDDFESGEGRPRTKDERRELAKKKMSKFYSSIKPKLSKDQDSFVKKEREKIIKMIIDGLSAQEAFSRVLGDNL